VFMESIPTPALPGSGHTGVISGHAHLAHGHPVDE
jgi:hypothetical protein